MCKYLLIYIVLQCDEQAGLTSNWSQSVLGKQNAFFKKYSEKYLALIHDFPRARLQPGNYQFSNEVIH